MARVETPAAQRRFIEGYGAGGFRVLGARHEGSLLIAAQWHAPWPVAHADGLSFDSLMPLIEAAPGAQILLVGCGARMQLLPAALKSRLREAGLVAEAMDTGAACRTYNVLLGEERQVAAALIAIG